MSDQQWFYLSFADPALPEGSQFKGAAYVRGSTLLEALARAYWLGITPSGEVRSLGPIAEEMIELNVPERDRERLLQKAELGEWSIWTT